MRKEIVFIIKYIALLFLLILFQSITAQEYNIDVLKLSVKEGLSNRFVREVYKDSNGFIWIGTQNGLNRYDGYNFKKYNINNSNLQSNNIENIFEDDQKQLWILQNDYKNSSRNVNLFDLKRDSLHNFSDVFDKKNPFQSIDIESVQANNDKEIWIKTVNGAVYRYKNNTFKLIYNVPETWKLTLFKVDNQFIWFEQKDASNTNNNLIKIVKVSLEGEFVERLVFPLNTRIVDIDTNSTIWIYNRDVEELKKTHEKYTIKSLDLDFLNVEEDMFRSKSYEKNKFNPYNNSLWRYEKGNKDFFYIIDLKTGNRIDLQKHLEPFFTYKLPRVIDLFFINKNQTWVSTEDGVFIITVKEKKFTTLLNNKNTTNSIRGITEDNNGVLHVNSYNERIRIAADRKQITRLPGESWKGITKDNDGAIWYGSYNNLLKKYNPSNGLEEDFYILDKGEIRQYLGLFVDKNKRLWAGTNSGLYYLNDSTKNLEKFKNFDSYPLFEKSNINYFEEYKEGIWIATSSGLYLMSHDRKIKKYFSSKQEFPNRIPFDHLLHFTRENEHLFWLTSAGGGLIKLDITTGKYEQFTTANELSSNTIYAAYEDDFNRLWLPSEYGLMLFDKDSYNVQTYLKNDGIAHNEFNTTSHYKATDGKFYFGGLSGITVVAPKKIKNDTVSKAPLRITNCQILNGKTGEINTITTAVKNSKTIQLSPTDTSLIINFSILNYENTGQNAYSYKIEGLEKNWTNTSYNTIRLNNLPYGNYTLRIKAQDIKGTKAINELAIAIKVVTPFYRNTWFILTSICVLIFLVFIAYQYKLKRLLLAKNTLEETVKERTKEIEKQAKKLKELDSLKSKFFTNISHELRTPITLILGPLHAIINKLPNYKNTDLPKITNSLKVMERNGKSLLNTVEEILDLSKLEANKIELQEHSISFYSFCKRIFSSFESLANNRNIDYIFSYELTKNLQLIIDDIKTEKIITNLISNAFKYSGDATKIEMSVTEENTFITIAISDTGLGIHSNDLPYVFDRFYQSKQLHAPVYGGAGIGLALCKELTLLMNGKIKVKSKLGEGSVFKVILPKKEAPTIQETPIIEHEEALDFTEITSEIIPFKSTNSPKKQTILIVEDHEDMRNFIVETLQDQYHILTAYHGEKALQILENKKPLPNIIVSDVMMPTMDGFTLLKHIKSSLKWQNIPVILLTARSAEKDLLNGLKIGVNDYITKPFNPPELIARIANLLKNYEERKEWLQKEKLKQTYISTDKEQEVSWDADWIKQAKEIVNKEIGNPKYKITDLAYEMNISESQLLLKMKQITGLTPKEFIREIKLQHARMLLESKAKRTIAEVAYAAGFNTPGYFSTVYENHFGKRPASYF